MTGGFKLLIRRNKGLSLVEAIIAIAVLGGLVIPAMAYLTSSLKWLLFLDNKQKSENQILSAVVELERDFKDMNQVLFCSSDRIDFFMDSYRDPAYNLAADPDSDNQLNEVDIDDDGDGLDATRTVRQFFALVGNPASQVGWRSGLDLNDDDDNNDGKRDVLCQYSYDTVTKDLRRRFKYNGGAFTPAKVIVSNLVSFSFTPSGGSPAEIDPNTGMTVPIADADGNDVLDLNELDVVTADGILNTFKETRYVRDIRYSMTIRPNPKRPETNSISSTIRPPLMAVKEKFQ
jgi:hypothetical protein